jgi:F0F1-type ATP synthase assembly protein I
MTEPVRPDHQQEIAGKSLSASDYAGAGIQLAVALVAFVLAGNWVDNRLGTSPAFVLAGVFIGGGAAFFSFYRRISTAQRLDDAERRKRAGKA